MSESASHTIRTPDQRLRVFVSSTLQEVADERKAARQAIEQLRLAPVMFELGARPHPPKDLYRAYLDQSDIFVGIYWQRYGWVAPDMDISGLEDEWRLSGDRPKLIYIKGPAPDRESRLKDLIDRIRNDDHVSYKPFTTADELHELIENDLALLLTERFDTSRPVEVAEPQPAARPRHNLPNQLTSFIGRTKEVTEVKRLIAAQRLITLVGPGGTGKSRLSLQVAAEVLPVFDHGVWLVQLAPLTNPALIMQAIAAIFELRELPNHPLAEAVTDYLRAKSLLLVLDNCEHLIEACAQLAEQLLSACPELKIVTSSREALGISGEAIYRVPSLSLPDQSNATLDTVARCEAVQLFIERAVAVQQHFGLTDQNAAAVAQICQRLDGIPLAIELAAARVKALKVEQIAERLDDRFRLLTGGSRTALPRQQTLRALIEWSYDLLSDQERRLFQRLAVFAGGWTLEAAESVGADEVEADRRVGPGAETRISPYEVLDLLTRLVDKSLVVMDDTATEAARYRFLETIRQFARDKLFESGEALAARDRHFFHYRNISNGLWDVSRLSSESETQRLKSMQTEMENLRAAFEWGLQNHVPDALELAADIATPMSMVGGIPDGITMLKSAMEKFRDLPPVEGDANRIRKETYAHGCFGLGTLLQGTNEIVLSRSILQEAIAIARELGDKHLLGVCLEMYANSSNMIRAGDTLAATLEGLEIFRELNDSAGLAMAYSNLARWETMHGNFQAGEKYVDLMRAIMNDAPISLQAGFMHLGLGFGLRQQGRLELAKHYFEDGLEIFKRLGHKGMMAVMTSEIAHTQRALGNFAAARKTYLETIKIYQDYGNRPAVAHQLECFAMIAIMEEEPQRAAKLFGAAEAIREITGHKRMDEEEAEEVQFMSRLRSMLAEEEFHALRAEGRALTMEQAIDLALTKV